MVDGIVRCGTCGIALETDEIVVQLMELEDTASGEDRDVPVWHYTHVGHDFRAAALGYVHTGEGRLADLVADQREAVAAGE